jgi:hypothetical protein
LCFTLVEDVLFFYGHYASHWPPLYQRVHKQHHEFKAPFAFAAAYAHPIEGLFGTYDCDYVHVHDGCGLRVLRLLRWGAKLCGQSTCYPCLWAHCSFTLTYLHCGFG